MWNPVYYMAPVVLGKYQDLFDEYSMTAFGVKDRQPRWQSCVEATLTTFGLAMSRPFVEEVYDETAKSMVCAEVVFKTYSSLRYQKIIDKVKSEIFLVL